MKKTKQIITAFFDTETVKRLDQEAEKHMRSRSSELLYIVRNYLAENISKPCTDKQAA